MNTSVCVGVAARTCVRVDVCMYVVTCTCVSQNHKTQNDTVRKINKKQLLMWKKSKDSTLYFKHCVFTVSVHAFPACLIFFSLELECLLLLFSVIFCSYTSERSGCFLGVCLVFFIRLCCNKNSIAKHHLSHCHKSRILQFKSRNHSKISTTIFFLSTLFFTQ